MVSYGYPEFEEHNLKSCVCRLLGPMQMEMKLVMVLTTLLAKKVDFCNLPNSELFLVKHHRTHYILDCVEMPQLKYLAYSGAGSIHISLLWKYWVSRRQEEDLEISNNTQHSLPFHSYLGRVYQCL